MKNYKELYEKEKEVRQNLEAKILDFSQTLKKYFEASKDDVTGIIRANFDDYFGITTEKKGIIE